MNPNKKTNDDDYVDNLLPSDLRDFEDDKPQDSMINKSGLESIENQKPASTSKDSKSNGSSDELESGDKQLGSNGDSKEHGGGALNKASESPAGKAFKLNDVNKLKTGGEGQSTGKTLQEGAKIASEIGEQRYVAAALHAAQNRKALFKLGVKIAIGVAGLGVVGFMIIAMLLAGIGGGIQGAAKGIRRAATAPARSMWNAGVTRLVEAQVFLGNDTKDDLIDDLTVSSSQKNKDIVNQLKSLDLNKSLQNYAKLGSNDDAHSNSSNLTGFAAIEDSLKETLIRKAGKNLHSDIKIEGDNVVIDGVKWNMTTLTAGDNKYSSKKLFREKLAESLGSALQTEDVAPQLNSFKTRLSRIYGLKYDSWPNKGADYDIKSHPDMNKDEAFKIAQKYVNGSTTTSLPTRHSRIVFVDKLQEEIKPKLKAAVDEGKRKPNDVAETELNKFLIENLFQANGIQDIALGQYSICLARDLIDAGDQAANASGKTPIEQSTESMTYGSMRQAMLFSSAADQINSGELNGNEIGANLDLYGDMYNQGGYQSTIFNSNWNGKQFTQLSNNSYTQLLSGPPPDGMIGEIVALVLNSLQATVEPITIHIPGTPVSYTPTTLRPVEQFSNTENRCGSTDDIKDFINPSFDFGNIFQNIIATIFGGGDDARQAILNTANGINQIFIKYILDEDGTRKPPQTQSILDTIPGSKFSSAIKLGFSFLLKASVYNNLALNYPGYSNENYVNQVSSGYLLLGNEMNRRMTFGRPLTLAEAQQQKRISYQEYKDDLDHQSIVEKVANINSPYSLLTKTAIATSAWQQDPSRMASSTANSIFSYIVQPSKIIQSAGQVALSPDFMTKSDFAIAATPASSTAYMTSKYPDINNGNVQWGWSSAELDKLNNDPSYSLLNNNHIVTKWIKAGGKEAKYMKSLEACYDKMPYKGAIVESTIDKLILSDPIMNKICKGMQNDVALRYRIYRSDLQIISDLKDLQTITQDSSGGSAPSPTDTSSTAGDDIDMEDLYKDSTSVACAPGSTDIGTQDGYSGGVKIPIKLCAIPTLPSSSDESTPGSKYFITGADGKAIVNSRVSGAVLNLVEAAKKDGIDIKASSSFRTMAHQQCLAGGGCGASGPAAEPGTSNHQMGLAIDFQLPSGNSGATRVGDPVYDWLVANSEKFGYKKLANEAWHFSPTGN